MRDTSHSCKKAERPPSQGEKRRCRFKSYFRAIGIAQKKLFCRFLPVFNFKIYKTKKGVVE
jgi:hypothetical protein